MKNQLFLIMSFAFTVFTFSCSDEPSDTVENRVGLTDGGQSTVVDDVSQKNVVQIAVGSADHSTLVAALKAASLVDALANAGPFTVFAPTNAAFDKLPEGTLDDLLKKENLLSLKNILQYHVTVSTFREDMLRDGQTLGMVNGGNVTIGKTTEGKITVNGVNVIGAVPASNGIVYVIDQVLLPSQ